MVYGSHERQHHFWQLWQCLRAPARKGASLTQAAAHACLCDTLLISLSQTLDSLNAKRVYTQGTIIRQSGADVCFVCLI